MSQPLDDLMPLFLAEAGERLERLGPLLDRALEDADALERARRELHALKGASRMIGLGDLSTICHRTETLLEDPTPTSVAGALTLLDELTRMVEDAPRSRRMSQTDHGGPEAGSSPDTEDGQAPRRNLRISADELDGLADRSARLRVLSVAGSGVVDRVYRLASLAEHGVGERAPRQVLATLATSLRQVAGELETGQRRMHRLSEGLLESLLRQQVRPLRPVLRHLAHHASELAESLGKSVSVSTHGGSTLLDRRIVDSLQEAMVHVVRNAIDHGIEAPAERRSAGKPEIASVVLTAATDGDRVRLEIRDDGRGIERDRVVRAAVQRGDMGADDAEGLDDEQLALLLAKPGLSTRDEASELSGRGIGLNAVSRAVREVGGELRINTRAGSGTTVTFEVPVTRRGERVLVLRIGQSRVALPATPARSYLRVERAQVVDHGGVLDIDGRGSPIPVRFVSDVLGEPPATDGVAILGSANGADLALVADDVVGEEEVFLRRCPSGLGIPSVYDGLAVLGSGRPVGVLSWSRLAFAGEADPGVVRRRTPKVIRVLLVDDSRVTREMIRRLLEDSGFAVETASSSEDALELLSGTAFDCLITDIEMPGMNGLELTRRLRHDESFEDLPIIVVSTRDRPSDHRAGLDAGADAYVSKQGLDPRQLAVLIRRSAGGGR